MNLSGIVKLQIFFNIFCVSSFNILTATQLKKVTIKLNFRMKQILKLVKIWEFCPGRTAEKCEKREAKRPTSNLFRELLRVKSWIYQRSLQLYHDCFFF
jgi:hypothetical protein